MIRSRLAVAMATGFRRGRGARLRGLSEAEQFTMQVADGDA
jgi:hypothetical protein